MYFAKKKNIPVIESQLLLLVIVSLCHRWSVYQVKYVVSTTSHNMYMNEQGTSCHVHIANIQIHLHIPVSDQS